VVKAQTNSKKITILPLGQEPKMNWEVSPVHKKIGPVFKGDSQKVVEAIKGSDPLMLREKLKEIKECDLSAGGRSFKITSEMVEFHKKIPENLSAAEFGKGTVYVDITLTPELEAEGYAREIIRRIQDMRKELDLRVEDQIRVVVDIESKPILDLALRLKEHIASEVRAAEFELGLGLKMRGALEKDWEIEGICVRISVDRI